MAETLNPKHLDKRTAERYQRSGQVDEAAYQRHLEELPDVSDKSVPVETRMNDEDFEDDEDLEDEDEGEDEAEEDDEDSGSAE